jgi:hypothetical protein
MPTELERLFHNEMLHIYERARTECHYTATRFLQMVVEQGGLAAAKALLHGKGLSKDCSGCVWKVGSICRWKR